MTDISHEKQKCKFQTSHQTTRSKQRVYNAERRNHTEPNCSHLPRTHPAQVRRAHMSTSLHRVRSYLYKRAIKQHRTKTNTNKGCVHPNKFLCTHKNSMEFQQINPLIFETSYLNTQTRINTTNVLIAFLLV